MLMALPDYLVESEMYPCLGIALIIWIGICVSAYFIQTPLQFYILAGVVGLVMGGNPVSF